MSTGVDSWMGAAEFGAIYPFAGWIEGPAVIVGVVIWVAWHIWQMKSENAEYDAALRHYNEVGLDKALDHRGRHDAMMDGH
ncbi:MAG: hypothetical protein CMM46_07250 [Rhodospirillaceae bacterium]|nr:hypothetical protein [Rhodospirillaceae bacterium]|tara:strand:+ start:12700 stop:12942 length:243 start_codon:yes stop_codon:yes gene_type:complete